MSLESARKCVERMKTDADFAAKVNACKTAEERSRFVKAQGFEFTPGEFAREMNALSERDLDGIDGGTRNLDYNDTTDAVDQGQLIHDQILQNYR